MCQNRVHIDWYRVKQLGGETVLVPSSCATQSARNEQREFKKQPCL